MTSAGWRSRGYLPHCNERGLVQHVVFGLNDGFRAAPPTIDDATERARWADREFDIGHGSCLLADSAAALIVEDSLLHGDGEYYALAAWCVMPTHVHVVIEMLESATVSAIVQGGLKGSTQHTR